MENLYDELHHSDCSSIAIVIDEQSLSYAELHKRIDLVATHISAKGIGAGDRVALSKLNSIELLIAYYACFKLGAIAVPLAFDDKERIAGAMSAAAIATTVSSLPTTSASAADLQQATNASEPTTEALVIFTSGTTSSTLKGVRLSHTAVSGTCDFMNRTMETDASLRECVFAPVDHAFGFGRCHSVLSLGGTVYLPGSTVRLTELLDILQRAPVNALSTTPAILASLLRVCRDDFERVGGQIRWIQTGAMRFDPHFRQSLLATLPAARIFLHYGLSEAMRVTFFELGRDPNKTHTEGQPAEGVELAIFDEGMRALPREQEGLIAIRGRNLCLGYLDQTLWQSCLHDGWFVTSDRGRLDADGYLVFCGRDDDTINSSGVLINPDEIEKKIQPHIGSQSISVVGVPDPMGIKDSIIVLCVEGESEVSLAQLASKMTNTDRHLLPQKMIELDELPRTRTSKINRAELRKRVVERLG